MKTRLTAPPNSTVYSRELFRFKGPDPQLCMHKTQAYMLHGSSLDIIVASMSKHHDKRANNAVKVKLMQLGQRSGAPRPSSDPFKHH